MKLKLRRSQKSGMTGKVTFKLFFIVDLDADEAAALKNTNSAKMWSTRRPRVRRHRRDLGWLQRRVALAE